jgi:NADH:ubiquinone oxidoreductase subunit 3 (subunit A)
MADILLSPPLAFIIFLGFAYAMYLFGKAIGAPAQPSPGKLEPYACGENFTAEKFAIGYRRFFIAALFFTLMHVAVLSIATVGGGEYTLRAMGYLVVIAASVSILYSEFD